VVTHADIPDDPAIESERRQFVFAAATGVTSCNIGAQTSNRFMLRIWREPREHAPAIDMPGIFVSACPIISRPC
jgi:hypothetical protein